MKWKIFLTLSLASLNGKQERVYIVCAILKNGFLPTLNLPRHNETFVIVNHKFNHKYLRFFLKMNG